MKRKLTSKAKLFFLTFFICFIVVPLAAPAQKIGLLMDSYVIDRWYKDQKYFVSKAEALGGTCLIEVAHGDPHEQLKLAQKLIDEGVDALVVVPCDALKAAEIVKISKLAGVPVISYDRLIMSNSLSLYVSYDSEKVGVLQAKYVLKKVPAGKYLLINGPTADNNAIEFRKGQLSVLQPHIDAGKIQLTGDLIMSDWSEIEALMKIDEYLSTGKPLPDVIIAANDALANGAIESLRNHQFSGRVLVTGQDGDVTALRNITSGTQSMTIYKPIKPLAHIAAESAIKLAKGERLHNLTTLKQGPIEVKSILLEPITVDQSNYKETVIKDGHVKETDLE